MRYPTSEDIEKLLEASAEKRVAILKRRAMPDGMKPVPAAPVRDGSGWTRESVSEYLKAHGISTRRQLELADGDAPPISCVKRLFGSWGNARDYAYGSGCIDDIPDDAGYIVGVVKKFKLWTRDSYCDARAKRPDIVPPVSWVRRHFGGYKLMMSVVLSDSLRAFLERYIALAVKYGRPPTNRECDENGLPMSMAYRHFGGKSRMDDSLFGMNNRVGRKGWQAKKRRKPRNRVKDKPEGVDNENL